MADFDEQDLAKLNGRQLLARAMQMYSGQPDVAALNEYAGQRQKQGQMDMMNALAAQYAGKGFQPVQESYLKRAVAAQSPQDVGDYGFISGGKFTASPFAGRKEQASALLNIGKSVMDNEEETIRQRRLAAQDAAREAAAERRFNAMYGGINGNASDAGYTPDGQRVVTDRKGVRYTMGQQGEKATYQPYEGDVIPPSEWNKQVETVKPLIASSNSIDKLLQKVDKTPEAFTRSLGFASGLPSFLGIRQEAQTFAADKNPEVLNTRAIFARNAAKELHDLYGAAQTHGESERAKAFLYEENDTPETIIPKLKAAKIWADDFAARNGAGVLKTARGRLGSGAGRTVVRRGTRNGKPVVQYSDGSIE